MDDYVTNHAIMEELTHQNQLFPISEFVDDFDTFANGSFPSHWHHELELQIILKGSAEYRVNGATYIVEEGNAIYIAPETVHMARQLLAGTVGYNIVLSPQFLINLMSSADREAYAAPLTTHRPSALVITPEGGESRTILEHLKKMHSTESTLRTYELFLLENVIGIWRNLLTLFPDHTLDSEDNGKILKEERMKLMLNYISQNYALPITIHDIANAANISKSECFRCFSDLLDTTPVEYINNFRLLQASQLLLTTEIKMSDICHMTGFNDTSYYAKKFKDQYGMSPKAYRSKKRKEREDKLHAEHPDTDNEVSP